MSNKDAKVGVGFCKPLVVGILAGASVAGHSMEPLEPEPGTLTEVTVKRPTDALVATPVHGEEPITEVPQTVRIIEALVSGSPISTNRPVMVGYRLDVDGKPWPAP